MHTFFHFFPVSSKFVQFQDWFWFSNGGTTAATGCPSSSRSRWTTSRRGWAAATRRRMPPTRRPPFRSARSGATRSTSSAEPSISASKPPLKRWDIFTIFPKRSINWDLFICWAWLFCVWLCVGAADLLRHEPLGPGPSDLLHLWGGCRQVLFTPSHTLRWGYIWFSLHTGIVTFPQCCESGFGAGSGSVCFWVSWIRIRIH